ncbi:hypothetical protein [Zavarzinella formosa]|uniref:hypothetical protein n=1 Tax=Zavarzinella formosa TaxID=360055 RepID=UPI0002DC1E7C|nr:hypothetical protein [Zavarzinella formosa]
MIAAVLLVAGCSSNNKGKIEGTKWTSQVSSGNARMIPAGFLTLEFKADGKFTKTTPDGNITGRYDLGSGDTVMLSLDQPVDGFQKLRSKFIIDGTSMTMLDPDGTAISFTRDN